MLDWPPTDDDIEEMVIDALEALPAPFRDQLGSVAIVIEDEATREQLDLVGAHGLYGLYQGVPRTRLSADAAPTPSKIAIFRVPSSVPTRLRTVSPRPWPRPSITRSPTISASPTRGSTSSSAGRRRRLSS